MREAHGLTATRPRSHSEGASHQMVQYQLSTLRKGRLAITALPRDIQPTSAFGTMPGHVEGKDSPALIAAAERPSQDGQRAPRSRANPADGLPSPELVPSAIPLPPFLPMLWSGVLQNCPSLAGRPGPLCHHATCE